MLNGTVDVVDNFCSYQTNLLPCLGSSRSIDASFRFHAFQSFFFTVVNENRNIMNTILKFETLLKSPGKQTKILMDEPASLWLI